MKKRILSILLAVALLLSVGVVPARAADSCVSVKADAATTAEVVAGDLLEIPLGDIFRDSDGHSLTYTLVNAAQFGTQTKVGGSTLYVSEKDPGTYEPKIKATCSGGKSVTATLTVTVKPAPHGLDAQYNYDESPAKEVTVYVTISNDGVPIRGRDGTILCHKAIKPVTNYNVTFTGTGAGDAKGAASVQENAAYTFTVDRKDNFEYTVTATMAGKDVTVTEGENGSYTIAKVTGDLVITVEKKSVSTMNVAVSKFVEMNNKTVFLVTVTGTPEDGKAFAYNENVMYKTTAYGENVYSWLVIVDRAADLTVDEATANITQAAATAEEVAAGYDVNETGVVDINDAQLTYDIYSGKYTDFEKVSVRKFLRADATSDKVVNAADAVAVVANSK